MGVAGSHTNSRNLDPGKRAQLPTPTPKCADWTTADPHSGSWYSTWQGDFWKHRRPGSEHLEQRFQPHPRRPEGTDSQDSLWPQWVWCPKEGSSICLLEYPSWFWSTGKCGARSRRQVCVSLIWGPRSQPKARGLVGFQETWHHLPQSGGVLPLERDSGTAAKRPVTNVAQSWRRRTPVQCRPSFCTLQSWLFLLHLPLCEVFSHVWASTYEKQVLATRLLNCEFHILHSGGAALWMFFWFKSAPVHRRCWCWFRWWRPPVLPAGPSWVSSESRCGSRPVLPAAVFSVWESPVASASLWVCDC